LISVPGKVKKKHFVWCKLPQHGPHAPGCVCGGERLALALVSGKSSLEYTTSQCILGQVPLGASNNTHPERQRPFTSYETPRLTRRTNERRLLERGRNDESTRYGGQPVALLRSPSLVCPAVCSLHHLETSGAGRSVHRTDTPESAAGLGGGWVGFCGLGRRFGVVERHQNHRQGRRFDHVGGFSLGESVWITQAWSLLRDLGQTTSYHERCQPWCCWGGSLPRHPSYPPPPNLRSHRTTAADNMNKTC
jgi:hypothetical protein